MAMDTPIWWRSIDGGVEFVVRVVPNARKSEVVGVVDGILRVRLAKPPVDGQANTELLQLIARWFGVRESKATVIRGSTSRIKTVRVDGVEHPPIT